MGQRPLSALFRVASAAAPYWLPNYGLLLLSHGNPCEIQKLFFFKLKGKERTP